MNMPNKPTTKEEAIALTNSGWWKSLPVHEAALWQLQEPVLCMTWDDFHRITAEACGRSVYTHEFADPASLIARIKHRHNIA